MRPEIDQVRYGIADDESVATVTRLGHDPAFLDQGMVGEVGGVEIGHERSGLVAQSVRQQQDPAVPENRPHKGELRPLDLTRDHGGCAEGRGARGGRAHEHGQSDREENG